MTTCVPQIFTFFMKRPTVILDCFTFVNHAYRLAPVAMGTKYFPSWWRALPTPPDKFSFDAGVRNNMKHCTGLVDLYRKAVVVPLWSELTVRVDSAHTNQVQYHFSDQVSQAFAHDVDEYKGFVDPAGFQHLKLHVPWHLETKEDINWVAVPPVYNQNLKEYQTMPGILNFKHQYSVNTQLMFPRPATGVADTTIPFNTPLLLLLPMSERRIEIRNHMLTVEEFRRIEPYRITNRRAGMIMRKVLRDAPQCPYHTKK